MTVKLALAEIRTKRGMTQEELARLLGMSLGGIQYIEYKATSVKLDLLDQLCTALECEPGDLFKRYEDRVEDGSQTKREKQRKQKSARMREWWAKKREEKEDEEKLNNAA